MTDVPARMLAGGVSMPAIGYGVAMLDDPAELEAGIHDAVNAGFRFFDCAPAYGNEEELGKALKSSGAKREELFISTKLPNYHHAYEKALAAFEKSRKLLGLDYIDQYIIHWPMPMQGLAHEAWRALEKLKSEGLVNVIGISNFNIHHIEKLLETAEIPPMTIEYECNPYYTRESERAYCKEKGIQIISWFPLGGPAVGRIPFPETSMGPLMDNEVVLAIARELGKTPAQVLLRWALDAGLVPIPKSSKKARIEENIAVFDFTLPDEATKRLDALNAERRFGPDPETFDKDE